MPAVFCIKVEYKRSNGRYNHAYKPHVCAKQEKTYCDQNVCNTIKD